MQLVKIENISSNLVLIGYKARNLSVIKKMGMPVPASWVLSGDVTFPYLKEYGLRIFSQGLRLEDAEKAYEYFYQHLSPELYTSLLRAVNSVLADVRGGRWVVRSSHPLEDGDTCSFAGLFRTELNLIEAGDITHAFIRCWRDSFELGVIEYCKFFNIKFIAPCAVLLQQLVSSQSAGVLFRQNDNLLIHGNWGLGQSIVNGLCKPDEWRRSSLVADTQFSLGDKKVAVIPLTMRICPDIGHEVKCLAIPGAPAARMQGKDSQSPLLLVELPEAVRHEACMKQHEIENLVAKAEKSADILQLCDIDVEWCMSPSKEIIILQIRPLTGQIPSVRVPEEDSPTHGLPVVGGLAEGVIEFVATEVHAQKFSSGAILVAKSLAGPVLRAAHKASGCILETESVVSHSAIIAREMGLPTIGSLTVESIQLGERYRIDGTTGKVERISVENTSLNYSLLQQNRSGDCLEKRLDLRPILAELRFFPSLVNETNEITLFVPVLDCAEYDCRGFENSDSSDIVLEAWLKIIDNIPSGTTLLFSHADGDFVSRVKFDYPKLNVKIVSNTGVSLADGQKPTLRKF